jgi:hypothetical protein
LCSLCAGSRSARGKVGSESSSAATLARAEPLTTLPRSARSRVSLSLAKAACENSLPHLPNSHLGSEIVPKIAPSQCLVLTVTRSTGGVRPSPDLVAGAANFIAQPGRCGSRVCVDRAGSHARAVRTQGSRGWERGWATAQAASASDKETQRPPRGAGGRALWGSARASVAAEAVVHPLSHTTKPAYGNCGLVSAQAS